MASKRNNPNLDEKILRALHSIFILDASRLKMDGHDMRKALGVGMREITPIKKAIDRTLKKYEKGIEKGNS